MKKGFIIFAVVIAIFGLLTWKLVHSSAVECEVCLNFENKTQCAKARGSSRDEAIEEAHRSACGFLTTGVTNTLACQRQTPTQSKCEP